MSAKRYILVELEDPDWLADPPGFVRDRVSGYGPNVRTADVTDLLQPETGLEWGVISEILDRLS